MTAHESRTLLVTPDATLAAEVAGAYGELGRPAPEEVCATLDDAERRLESGETAIVLIDARAGREATLAAIERLVADHPAVRCVVLEATVDQDLVLDAMQSGARFCIDLTRLTDDVERMLRRLGAPARPRTADGRVISVLGARGGCGATTLSINLADLLGRAESSPCLVVDVDVHHAAVAAALGVDAPYGVGDVLDHAGGPDAQLVRSTAATSDAHLHVLAAPPQLGRRPVTADDCTRLGPALRAAYRTNVVDAARLDAGALSALAQQSDAVVLVFELAVIDLRRARALVSYLEEHGVTDVVPVANRFRKRSASLSTRSASDALGGRDVHVLANDFNGAIKALNLGRPLAEVAPRSPLLGDLRRLLERLHTPHASPTRVLP